MAKKISPQIDEKGRTFIGPRNTSFGRHAYLVNPSDRSWTINRYVLWFGQVGTTNLMVWANSLEDALEEAAEWLAKHAPGYIMDEWSDEYKALVCEVCEEQGITFPEGFDALADKTKCSICEQAETDLTRTESGFITSYEWGIQLEDPTRAELDEWLYPAGVDWSAEREGR